jgi:hypothetical protein
MTWNWQKPDWPNFRWDRGRLEAAEKQFLVGGGVFVGTVRHLGKLLSPERRRGAVSHAREMYQISERHAAAAPAIMRLCAIRCAHR